MAFKGLRFAAAEIRHASAGTIMKVVMVAISVIPLLYGGLYLAAFLDPYENLDTVPVAVVNEDAGAEVSGEWRVVGDDVVEKLEDNHDGLGWHFVSADEARAGIEDGTYYMTCTIPSDFTEAIASADSDAPTKAAFTIEYNQSKNMLASQIGETVWKEVRTQVSDTVAEEYWNTVFDRLNDGGDQIQTAADGAGELHDGLETAHDGSATITDNLGTLTDGTDSLVSGLVQLVSGAAALKDGTGTLASGAGDLKSGADTLASGASTLSSGASQLKSEGTSALASGANDLKSGVGKVSAGVSQLQDGIGSASDTSSSTLLGGVNQLITGLTQLKGDASQGTGLAYAAAGAHQLASSLGDTSTFDGGIAQLQSGVAAVKSGLKDSPTASVDAALSAALQYLDAGNTAAAKQYIETAQTVIGTSSDTSSDTLYGGLNQISAGLTSLQSTADSSLVTASGAAGDIADGLDTAVASIGSTDTAGQTLLYGASSLKNGLGTLSSGADQIAAGIGAASDTSSSTLYGGANQLASGAATVDSKMGSVVSGAGSVSSGASQLADGAGQVQSGAAKLDDGAGQLASGSQAAKDGAAQIASGALQLRDGSSTLTEGLVDAVDGALELADGLADGADELHVDGAEQKAEVMSAPVELASEYYTTVKNYGTGFAPYFIALGLWVGALMAGFVLKPLNRRLVLSGGNPAMAAFSSFMPLALMSVVQALLMLVALQFGLQLQIDNVAGYYAFGILVALAFAAFMQFLMSAFGFPGKFIAIILLMLQLTSAAGTFPIEQTPAFFQALNPFMPMTYVVAGMRQIMTGVDYATVASSVAVLAGIGIVSFGLTTLVARFKRMITMEDLHPLLNLG